MSEGVTHRRVRLATRNSSSMIKTGKPVKNHRSHKIFLSSSRSSSPARVRSHSRLGPEGQMGHLITNALARPFSISSFRLADLGGEANYHLRGQPKPLPIPLG